MVYLGRNFHGLIRFALMYVGVWRWRWGSVNQQNDTSANDVGVDFINETAHQRLNYFSVYQRKNKSTIDVDVAVSTKPHINDWCRRSVYQQTGTSTIGVDVSFMNKTIRQRCFFSLLKSTLTIRNDACLPMLAMSTSRLTFTVSSSGIHCLSERGAEAAMVVHGAQVAAARWDNLAHNIGLYFTMSLMIISSCRQVDKRILRFVTDLWIFFVLDKVLRVRQSFQ